MSETPDDLIKKAVLWLREADKVLSLPIRDTKYKMPWDLDWIRLKWRDRREDLPMQLFGREIVVTGDPKTRADKKPVVDIGDLMLFQFIPKDGFDFIMNTYAAFGRLSLVRIDDKHLDKLYGYAEKMDNKIMAAVKRLQERGVRNIFHLLRKEMGGDAIRSDDRLGQRLRYYCEIIDRYKNDKANYSNDLLKLKIG